MTDDGKVIGDTKGGSIELLPGTADADNLEGNMVFQVGSDEVLRFEQNGEVYVRGNLVETDMAVLDGFKEWLRRAKAVQRS